MIKNTPKKDEDLFLPPCPSCGNACEPWIIYHMERPSASRWGFRCLPCGWKIESQMPYEDFIELCKLYEDAQNSIPM